MREHRFREGDACSVRGCNFPVFWTEEGLCRDHVIKRDLAPPPGDDPFAKAGASDAPSPAVPPPAPVSAGKTKTPKE